MKRRRKRSSAWRLFAATAITASLLAAPAGAPAASAADEASFSASQTIPVPPASSYAGGGGGDGWDVVMTPKAVFNAFHHAGRLTVACHLQADASACWSPKTIVDEQGHHFATPGQSGLWMDQGTERLYAYSTRTSDSTAGVVCVDTNEADAGKDPFCGFTALSAVGEAPVSGNSGLSGPLNIGGRLYAFNYASGSAVEGTRNKMLCFDLVELAACALQPYTVDIGDGTVSAASFPAPATAAIGGLVVVPVVVGGAEHLACYDTVAQGGCSGAWPVAAPSGYISRNGSAYPMLDEGATVVGLCLPASGNPCYDLAGAAVATPAGMSAVLSPNTGWNGPAFVLGPRVYLANGNVDQVQCFDYSSGSSCSAFPKQMTNLGYMYTVNPDPQRPSCIWANGDYGSAQIQNFDAYAAGPCGQGAIRVLASQIVVPTVECRPTTYSSFQVTQPDRSSYTSGTVTFVDGNDKQIQGVDPQELDENGRVSLTGLGLNTKSGLPQFLITLNGVSGGVGSVSVTLTWTSSSDPSCDPTGERARLVHVAVGDSYSSGEGAPPFEDGTNYPFVPQQENTLTYGPGANGCHRSLTNYAKIATAHLEPGIEPLLIDRTCSGATIVPGATEKGPIAPTSKTIDRTDGQVNQAMARLQAEGRDASSVQVVTATMGGNDAGFGDLINACLIPNVLKSLFESYGEAPGEIEFLSSRVGCAQYDAAFFKTGERIEKLQALEQEAQNGLLLAFPKARVLQLTYPGIVPSKDKFAGDSCGGVLANDAAYVRDKVKEINDAIRKAAAASSSTRLEIVDIESSFGSDALCPADPTRALANGVDQARLNALIDELVAPGSEVRPLLDELKSRYVGFRNCVASAKLAAVVICKNSLDNLNEAFEDLKAYFTPDEIRNLVSSLAPGATPDQRFDNSRLLFHPNRTGFDLMSCHLTAVYQGGSRSGCAPQPGGELAYSLNGVRLVHLTPTVVQPRSLLDVLFNGWDIDSIVEAIVRSEPTSLGELKADGTGTVRGSLQLPDLTPGVHKLTLSGTSNGKARRIDLLLQVPGSPVPGKDYGVYQTGLGGEQSVTVQYGDLPWGTFTPDADGGLYIEVPVPQLEPGESLPLTLTGATTGTTTTHQLTRLPDAGGGGGAPTPPLPPAPPGGPTTTPPPPVPIAPTAAGAPAAPAAVGIGLQTRRITAGNSPSVVATVTDAAGAAVSGTPVVLLAKRYSETAYSPVGAAVGTDAQGQALFRVRPDRQTAYVARAGSVQSRAVVQFVHARLDVTNPAVDNRVARRTTFSGKATPGLGNGALIGVGLLRNGRFSVLAQRAATAGGAFEVSASLPVGTNTYIVFTSARSGTLQGARSLRLTVR